MDIRDKVVLITGASSGIGRAAAELFAAQGAKVALAARSADRLAELAERLPGALAVPTDMLDEAAVAQMVRTTQEHYGRIDVLVNNAGRGMHVPVLEARLADYRQLLELNLVSVLGAMQQVAPVMQAGGGGSIVNISSGTTKGLFPGLAPYSSTKHALNNLSLIARTELAPLGITVSVVYPGMTDTEFGHNLVGAAPERAAAYRRGDSAQSVAELIVRAVTTGEAEVYAASVQARMDAAQRP